MAERLPVVGGDTDVWGTVLNGFLNVAHNANGTLRTVGLGSGGSGSSFASVLDFVKGLNLALWKPAADIAAAATLPLANPLDGNVINVTGNTGITAIATTGINIGTVVKLKFTGTPVITHSANLVMLNGLSYTVVAGDILEFTLTSAGVWSQTGLPFVFQQGMGQCRFGFTSGTAVTLAPHNGRLLPVKTGGVWRLRDIGSSGIVSGNPTTASNFVNGTGSQTLSPSTVYLVTVFDNAGVLTMDFITTLTHTADATTGVEIKSGDSTRTVIGMVQTTGATNFQQSGNLLGVISWYNRRSVSGFGQYTAQRTTASAALIELHGEIRVNFLHWFEDEYQVIFIGSGYGSIVTQTAVALGLDGGSDGVGTVVDSGNGVSLGISIAWTKAGGFNEGAHYYTILGSIAGGNTLTVNPVSLLQVTVRG